MDEIVIHQNPTGSRDEKGQFLPGHGLSKGRRLNEGQKIVRDFAVGCLQDMLQRLKLMYQCEDTPIEIRERIMFRLIDRAAGRVPEGEPYHDSEPDTVNQMPGYRILELAAWIMDKEKEGKGN